MSRRQLLEVVRFEPHQIKYRTQIGRLHPQLRGTYSVGRTRLDPRGRLWANLLAAGDGATAWRRAAVALHDLRKTARIEIAIPPHRRSSLRTTTRARLDPQDLTTVEGIPTTAWPITILDFGAVESLNAVRKMLDRAVTLQLFDLTALHDVLDRHPKRPGSRALREAMARITDDGDRARSDHERDFATFVEQFEIPPPAQNVPLLGYEADAMWMRERVIVELDSWSWHGGHVQWHFDVLRLNYDDIHIRGAISARRILRRLAVAQPHTGHGEEPARA